MGAKVHCREGNNPDCQLKAPKGILSRTNAVRLLRQLGCWLGSSHSFKECVTAH